MDIRRAFIVSLVGAALLSVPRVQPAGAQTVGASLQGFITDSTGAVLPNAQIVVLNLSTGAKLELTSDRAGRYRVPVLPPGVPDAPEINREEVTRDGAVLGRPEASRVIVLMCHEEREEVFRLLADLGAKPVDLASELAQLVPHLEAPGA